MKPETFINKIQPDPDGLDFKGFREEGIKIVQDLSGDVWTDYNLHDPGITILEALSYGLTDLVYRAGFDVEDYLVSDNGEIDFDTLGLFRPDEIFSCNPLTDNDYRKLILNSVSNTDNVWIERHSEGRGETPGLCRIFVLLSEQVRDQCNAGTRREYIEKVESIYSANRNLCEDLVEVKIVDRQPHSLSGEIEIDGKKEPAAVFAKIYFECEQYLSPQVDFHSYREMHVNGDSLENLFTGVLTGNGYIAEDELPAWRGQFSIPELIGRLSRIEGVRNIGRLHFVGPDGEPKDYINLDRTLSCRAVACMQSPSVGVASLRLHTADKTYHISPHDVEMAYAGLDYQSQALRYQKNRFDWVGEMMPTASVRSISDYYSIQNNFPAVYGINSYGVPDSYPAARKAQAMQLKAYLLFFEQIMANFLQNADEIKNLFSLNESPKKQSYFYQVLRNAEVPEVEKIYMGNYDEINSGMSKRLAQFDNYGDRRNRVLDYLLGIYGETFNQNSLRHFFAEGADTEDALIRNKLAFLKDIVAANKSRAAAFDCRQPSSGDKNCSGLKKKLKLILGLGPGGAAPAEDVLGNINQFRESMQIVEHILLRPLGETVHHGHTIPKDFYGFKVSVIFHAVPDLPASREFRKLAEQSVHKNCPAHIYPEVLWLEPGEMREFNTLHEKWLEAKRMVGMSAAEIDAASGPLIAFLRRHQGREK